MDARKNLETWLQNAHALEENIAKMLQQQMADGSAEPDLVARLQEHLQETERHKDQVTECLNIMGTKTSSARSMAGKASGMVSGMVSGMLTGMLREQTVRNVAMDFAMENLEIAVYESIIAIADVLNQERVAQICREILEDEERMAAWLRERIPQIASHHVATT